MERFFGTNHFLIYHHPFLSFYLFDEVLSSVIFQFSVLVLFLEVHIVWLLYSQSPLLLSLTALAPHRDLSRQFVFVVVV